MSPWLPGAGLLIAVWAAVPPYVGPGLATEMRVEVADHVVPGVLVAVLAVSAYFLGAVRGGMLLLPVGLLIALAGVWMVATHVPLLPQALRNEASWVSVAHHSLPGLAVLVLGLVWAWLHWTHTPFQNGEHRA